MKAALLLVRFDKWEVTDLGLFCFPSCAKSNNYYYLGGAQKKGAFFLSDTRVKRGMLSLERGYEMGRYCHCVGLTSNCDNVGVNGKKK